MWQIIFSKDSHSDISHIPHGFALEICHSIRKQNLFSLPFSVDGSCDCLSNRHDEKNIAPVLWEALKLGLQGPLPVFWKTASGEERRPPEKSMLCEAQARGVTTPEESSIEVSEEAILELPL